MEMLKKYKKGFTIAELVVAMMIIAAISMIMVPMLYSDTKKQVLETSLQKTYTQLGQTAQSIGLLQARGKIAPNITDLEDVFIDAVIYTNKVISVPTGKEHMANNLLSEKKRNEYLKSYNENYEKNNENVLFNGANTIVLKNGVFIVADSDDNKVPAGYTTRKDIIVDVNGKKGPNIIGDDIFYFSLLKDNSSSVTIKPRLDCNEEYAQYCAAATILGE